MGELSLLKVLVWVVIIFATLSIIFATYFFRIHYKENKMNQVEYENYMYLDFPKENDFQREELWLVEYECNCPVCGSYSHYDDGDAIHCHVCQSKYIYDGKEWRSVEIR